MLMFSRTAKYSAHRFLLFRNKSVLCEVNNVACGSHIRRRGRSYAVYVPSDSPEPQRSRKKVSKDERRALVESFVNEYRTEHDGKFPTAKDAMRKVGGGYYFIRTIIQELEYKSKMSTSDRGTKIISAGKTEKNKVIVDVGTQNELDMLAADDVEINDASKKYLGDQGSIASSVAANTLSEDVEKIAAQGGQSDLFATQSDLLTGNGENVSRSSLEKADDKKMKEAQGRPSDFATDIHPIKEEMQENFHKYHENANGKKEKAEDLPKFVETESHKLKGETEKVSPLRFGNVDVNKEQSVSEASLNSGGPKQEAEPHKLSPEAEKNATDVSSKQPDEAEHPKQSTLWGNLKSFADGFIRMWRKS